LHLVIIQILSIHLISESDVLVYTVTGKLIPIVILEHQLQGEY